jgi:hypothetical protein
MYGKSLENREKRERRGGFRESRRKMDLEPFSGLEK